MRKLLPVFILTGIATSAVAQQKITIRGTIKGDLKGYHKVYVLDDRERTDSVEIKNGRFTIVLPWVKDKVPGIQAEYDTRQKPVLSAFHIVADKPGTVYIDVEDVTKGIRSGKIRGIGSAVAYQAFEQGREQVRQEVNATIQERFQDKPKTDSVRSRATMELMLQRLILHIGDFVEANADAYIGAFILGRYQSVLPAELLEKLYNKLSPEQKRSPQGVEVGERLLGFKRAEPGQEVMDFTLHSPDDLPVAFSSYRGKYILIDFWASWCGPCKAAFPQMKELYEKYRGEKFEMVGISIDEKKAAWLKELEKQQLPWPQLLDTKKVSVNGFAVSAVPTGYLISPEGKIIMRQVGFGEKGEGEIEQKLKEIFGK